MSLELFNVRELCYNGLPNLCSIEYHVSSRYGANQAVFELVYRQNRVIS